MKKILLIFFIIFGIALSGKISAQISLSVSPQKFDLVLLEGETFEGFFKLTNHNDFALPILIKISPFSAKEGTGEMVFEEIEKDSPVFWFSFEKKELILQPKETKRIKFKIEVPKGTKPGGYFVFVYFEPVFPSYLFEKSGPKVIPMIGVPFLISTSQFLLEPASGKEIEILEFSIPKKERVKILEDSLKFVFGNTTKFLASLGVALAAKEPEIFVTKTLPNSFFVTIKNNDIYHLKPEGKIFLYDIFGREIGKGELKGQTILPGKTRRFEIFLTEDKTFSPRKILNFLFSGKINARLEIKLQSPVRGTISLKNTPSFNFFPLNSFFLIFSFVIIVLILFLARKRILLAFKILLEKEE